MPYRALCDAKHSVPRRLADVQLDPKKKLRVETQRASVSLRRIKNSSSDVNLWQCFSSEH